MELELAVSTVEPNKNCNLLQSWTRKMALIHFGRPPPAATTAASQLLVLLWPVGGHFCVAAVFVAAVCAMYRQVDDEKLIIINQVENLSRCDSG